MTADGSHDDSQSAAPLRFESLFRQNADTVLAYATRRSDPDTAQEVVAETFAVAWRRLDVVPDPALPWLLGVARKVLANERRSRGRAEALTVRLVGSPVVSSDDPAEVVDARLAARAALDRLPSSEREVLQIIAWEGLSTAQAADALGCSRAAIAVRMHRARRHFYRLLEGPSEPRTSGRATPETGQRQIDGIPRSAKTKGAS